MEMRREKGAIKELVELIEKLSLSFKRRYRDFAQFLLERWARKQERKPKFEWAGALKELRDRYTSVDLQHEISRWREEGNPPS